MTIQISEGGTYKKAKSAFVSQGGEWIALKQEIPRIAELSFSGTPENGAFIVTMHADEVYGYQTALFARDWADGRAAVAPVAQAILPNATEESSVVFTPLAFASPFRGLLGVGSVPAAIYWAVVIGPDEVPYTTAEIIVNGEADFSQGLFMTKRHYFTVEPNGGTTVAYVYHYSGDLSNQSPPYVASYDTWLNGDKTYCYLSQWNVDARFLAPGWSGAIDMVRFRTKGSGTALQRQTADPAVGAAFPTETLIQGSITTGLKIPFDPAVWNYSGAGGMAAHDTTNHMPSTSDRYTDGLSAIGFISSANTYQTTTATIVKQSPSELLVTGTPGEIISVRYQPPIAGSGYHNSVKKTLDGNGQTLFGPNDFLRMLPIGNVVNLWGGVYSIPNSAARQPALVNGIVVTHASQMYGGYSYGYSYGDTGYATVRNGYDYSGSIYGVASTGIASYTYQYNSSSGAASSYICVYGRPAKPGRNDAVPFPGWSAPVPGEYYAQAYSAAVNFNIFGLSNTFATNIPNPIETLLFATSSVANYTKGLFYPTGITDAIIAGYPGGLTAGERSANPTPGDINNWGSVGVGLSVSRGCYLMPSMYFEVADAALARTASLDLSITPTIQEDFFEPGLIDENLDQDHLRQILNSGGVR